MHGFLARAASRDDRLARYNELVAEYYDAVTPFYQYGWGESFHFAPFRNGESLEEAIRAQQAELVRHAKIRTDMRVLDVGCGIGGPARSIARMTGAHVRGLTISATQVARARRLTRKRGLEPLCRFELGDAMAMRYPDDHFDAVYAIESACHMPDKARFYAGCARVLRPGGIFAGWDWVRTRALRTAEHAELIESIHRHFAIPELSTLDEIAAYLGAAKLEVICVEDKGLASGAARRWWHPLDAQLRRPLARLTARLSRTLRLMHGSGEALVAAGKAEVFSPLGLFVARKPAPTG